MKTVINTLMVLILVGFFSCINEEGPVGPQGEKGDKGDSGFVFEYENIDFTAPNYEVFLPFPDDFESYSSDVAIVYLLWDVVEIDGIDTEIWRQLPQSILTNDGVLQYNFDFSMVDVRLFMDAEFDMSFLGALDTDDWVARVVIVPGDFWNSSRIAAGELEYNDLKEMLGLPEMPIPESRIHRRK